MPLCRVLIGKTFMQSLDNMTQPALSHFQPLHHCPHSLMPLSLCVCACASPDIPTFCFPVVITYRAHQLIAVQRVALTGCTLDDSLIILQQLLKIPGHNLMSRQWLKSDSEKIIIYSDRKITNNVIISVQ